MNDVTYAECKRVLERADQLCADVEVTVEGESRHYIALFAETNDKELDMVMLLAKDADPDIDWYDNDLHAAYKDVTETMFRNRHGEELKSEREKFKEQILSFGDVRSQVRVKLDEAAAAKV